MPISNTTYFFLSKAILREKEKTTKAIQEVVTIAAQTRAFVVQRGGKIQIDILFARKRILRFLPLQEINKHADTIFESVETQRLILEQIIKMCMVKGIMEPTENDICNSAMEICFSDYLRAHMAWGDAIEQ